MVAVWCFPWFQNVYVSVPYHVPSGGHQHNPRAPWSGRRTSSSSLFLCSWPPHVAQRWSYHGFAARQFPGMMTAGCRATLDRHQSQSWNLASVWNDRKGSTQLSEFQRLTLRVDKRPRDSTDSCARRCFAVTPQSAAFRCTKRGNGCQLCRFFFSPTRSAWK